MEGLDETLCYCFHIPKRKVVNFVRQTRPARASQISECFGAGSGCGWCVPYLIEIHRQVMEGEESDAAGADAPSATHRAALRADYLQAIKCGERQKNDIRVRERRYDGKPLVDEEAFDCSRYFSRARPDPEPDDLSETEEG